MKIAIGNGIDLNSGLNDGRGTPIFSMVQWAKIPYSRRKGQIAQLLVENGVDYLATRDQEGRTPIFKAMEKQDWRLFEAMVKRGIEPEKKYQIGNRSKTIWEFAREIDHNNPNQSATKLTDIYRRYYDVSWYKRL